MANFAIISLNFFGQSTIHSKGALEKWISSLSLMARLSSEGTPGPSAHPCTRPGASPALHDSRFTLQVFNTFSAFRASRTRRINRPFLASGGVAK
jgi:hypothetical protein